MLLKPHKASSKYLWIPCDSFYVFCGLSLTCLLGYQVAQKVYVSGFDTAFCCIDNLMLHKVTISPCAWLSFRVICYFQCYMSWNNQKGWHIYRVVVIILTSVSSHTHPTWFTHNAQLWSHYCADSRPLNNLSTLKTSDCLTKCQWTNIIPAHF